MPPATYQYVDTQGNLKTTTDQANAPGKDPHSGFQTITSSTLAPANNQKYTTPSYTPTPDIQALPTDAILTATPQENQISDLTKRAMDIQNSLVGKDAYQAQQDTAAGVDSITQAINDNNTAVKQLQNDTNISKLRQEDRLAPTFAISGSQGAIDRNAAVKALTLSSISDVLQNNLVSAQHKADKAVAAQYGPLEAELKAKLANIQLIQNDPATTLADKNRAAQQAYVLQQTSAQLADKKAETQGINKLVLEAGQNAKAFVATKDYPTLSTALNAIATAKTLEEAVAIEAATGLAKGTAPKVLGSASAGYYTYDPATGTTAPLIGGSGGGSGGTPVGKGTPTGFTQTDIKSGDTVLRTGVDGSGAKIGNGIGADGYIDPTVYVTLLNHWISNGGTKDSFFTYYPADRYINPANDWVWGQLGIPNPAKKRSL